MSNSKKTNIYDLPAETAIRIEYIKTDTIENLLERASDFSLPVEMCIQYVEEIYSRFGLSECIELINRLSLMYQMSGTKILEKYMCGLANKKCNIPLSLKMIAVKSLCYFKPEEKIGYELLDEMLSDILNNPNTEITTPVKIENIHLLMRNPLYKNQSRNYFCMVVNDTKLYCDYRYKTILFLESVEIKEKEFFIKESAFEFFVYEKNLTVYRILAGQLIIQKYKPTIKEQETIEIGLLSFAGDEKLDYNIRADSADVILKLGCDENKKKARNIIMELGRQGMRNSKNIFENKQNVHITDIEESVLEAIEFLSNIETKKITNNQDSQNINFDYVRKQIMDMVKETKQGKKDSKEYKDYKTKKDYIVISLNRIFLDRALYTKFNHTLSSVLLKVWSYISCHKFEEAMKGRLLEELVEMSGTCSSGFASRLVNVISGFGDFNLRISWKDQIISNFTGRLNVKARNITAETQIAENCKLYEIKEQIIDNLSLFQEKVLEEMIVNVNDFSMRMNFLTFLRANVMSIRNELYDEFKSYISDTDFELYFRQAVSSYEIGDYV